MFDTYRYKVDFSNIKNYWEIHEILSRDLDFPDYYGGSLDSLWDCLTDQLLSGTTYLEIIGLEKIVKYNSYDVKLKELLAKVKHAYNNEFSENFLVTIIHEDGTKEEII